MDPIDRQAAIDEVVAWLKDCMSDKKNGKPLTERLRDLPSVQPKQTDCDYCHADFDGYVRPIEKNSHAWLVRRGRTMKLRVCFKGEYRECDILFCPMCGRRLTDG